MKRNNNAAFPMHVPDDYKMGSEGFVQYGMTKREYFAMQILKSIVGKPGSLAKSEIDTLVPTCLRLTDELLSSLS